MKIVDVKAHVLRSPLAQPFAFAQGRVGVAIPQRPGLGIEVSRATLEKYAV